MGSLLDYITSSAVSLTVSGNTGISPFLTLFLLGVVEKSDPSLLNMDGWIETILSSWIAIIILGILTGLEFIGKCVPVIDELIDSVEVFVVPVLSILGSLGTMGLLDLAQEEATMMSEGNRRLNVGDSVLTFIKTVLVIVGVFLALAIHFFKMIVRLIGLTVCAGCCQPCITIVEVTTVIIGVLVAILIRQIAIVTCILLFLAAGYTIKRKFLDKKDEASENSDNNNQTSAQAPAQAGQSPAQAQGQSPAPVPAPAVIIKASMPNHDTAVSHQTDNDEKTKDIQSPAVHHPEPTNVQPTAPVEVLPSSSIETDNPPSANPDYIEIKLTQCDDNDNDEDPESQPVEATAVAVNTEKHTES